MSTMTALPPLEPSLVPAGRHLAFSNEHSAVAHVYRRVGGLAGTWVRLAANARSPFLDAEPFPPGTLVEYFVQLATRFGDQEARSRVVAVRAPAAPPPGEVASCY